MQVSHYLPDCWIIMYQRGCSPPRRMQKHVPQEGSLSGATFAVLFYFRAARVLFLQNGKTHIYGLCCLDNRQWQMTSLAAVAATWGTLQGEGKKRYFWSSAGLQAGKWSGQFIHFKISAHGFGLQQTQKECLALKGEHMECSRGFHAWGDVQILYLPPRWLNISFSYSHWLLDDS